MTCQGGRENRLQGEVAPSHSALDCSPREQRFGRRCLWATRLTWTGNRKGTTAWRESADVVKALMASPRKTRVIWRRP